VHFAARVEKSAVVFAVVPAFALSLSAYVVAKIATFTQTHPQSPSYFFGESVEL
jgi:hypothetical protein